MASIVQEWGASPNTNTTSSIVALEQKIRQEALENGIERPKGYNVSFHYNADVEQHHFGRSHPMKPWRLHLTKQLVLSYGLQYAMDVYQTKEASKEELAVFHKGEYLDFLSQITPDNMASPPLSEQLLQYNFGDDCPVFDGLYRYCKLYTGASLSAARNLTSGQSDVAINWSGGLHHAKKSEASGFCYINDIVLAILELLRYHPRVLYIDIDVHHGDGVEQAFASTDRVLTLSLHKFDKAFFFPGTGGLDETGPDDPRNPGAHHSLNAPLKDGIDDEQYIWLFKKLAGEAVAKFQPTAIVLQCGADSLGGDRLGKFNLNIRAHGECLSYIQATGLPLLVVGGGGYTARNVARLWCHETSLLVGADLRDELPAHVPYRQAFTGPDNGDGLLYPELHNIEGRRHRNEHTEQYLQEIVRKLHEQLRYMEGAPSVAMRAMPADVWKLREDIDAELRDEEEAEMEEKRGQVGGGGGGRRREKERNIGGRGEMV